MAKIVLFAGGTRSGKSAAAERYAAHLQRPVAYVATAAPGDEEMRERIARHRARRPAGWRTLEIQQQVGEALHSIEPESVVLLDCLTLLVSNILLAHEERAVAALEREIGELLRAVEEQRLTLVAVTSEVGLGLVPADPLSRRYCDLLGQAAQQIAARAAEVYVVMLGIPVELYALQAKWAREVRSK